MGARLTLVQIISVSLNSDTYNDNARGEVIEVCSGAKIVNKNSYMNICRVFQMGGGGEGGQYFLSLCILIIKKKS